MSRVLAGPSLAAAPRRLDAPSPASDAFVQELVAQAAEQAYERGRADGAREACDAAERAAAAAADRAAQAARAALAEAVAEMRGLRAAQAGGDVELARLIARAVLGREPADSAAVLLERVRAALSELDEAPLLVHASPADAPVLDAGLATGDIEVAADPAMPDGQARVSGRWASADLRREAAWDVVRTICEDPADA